MISRSGAFAIAMMAAMCIPPIHRRGFKSPSKQDTDPNYRKKIDTPKSQRIQFSCDGMEDSAATACPAYQRNQ